VAAKIRYHHISADIDEFIQFAAELLIEYISSLRSMAMGIRAFLDDQVTSAAALVIMVSMKRCAPNVPTKMMYAHFAYFLVNHDNKAVDVLSKRQVSCVFSRFQRYEEQLVEHGLCDQFMERLVKLMRDLKDSVLEWRHMNGM